MVAACAEAAPVAETPPSTSRASVRAERTFARLSRGTVGPYLAEGASGFLAVWAGPDGEGTGWFARAFDAKGRALDKVRHVATEAATQAPALVRLTRYGRGYLAVWSTSDAQGPILASLALDSDGRLLAPPQTLPSPGAAPLWIELVPTAEGGILVWAEPGAGLARLYVLELDDAGAPASNPAALPAPARAWQAAPSGKGAAVLVATERRNLELVHVSARGELGPSHVIPGAEGVGSDVDLVAANDRLFYAFTRATALDPQVFVGVADEAAVPVGITRPAVPPLGEQQLLGLVAGGGHAFLAWQDPVQTPGIVKVGALSSEGGVSSEPVLLPWDGTAPVPEFVATEAGLHALLWSCVEAIGCSEPLVPTRVDLDSTLTPKAVAPWFADQRVPDLAWNLSCGERDCFALGAVFGNPSHAYLLGSERAPGRWLTPAWKASKRRPRVRELTALFEPLALSGFDAAASDAGTLISWLSYFDPATPYVTPDKPAPDGRLAPVRAQLWTQWIPESRDEALPEPTVASYRAHSPGGVALSPGSKANLLVWSALDASIPQVFTTLVDARGKKIAQQMLTRQTGNVSSVAALAVSGGWAVGWIDERSKKPAPYLALIGERLARRLPDQRIGNGAGSALGAAFDVVGDEVWHVRSETFDDGAGALTLARLAGKNLKPRSEVVLARDGSSYRSPSFLPGAARPLVVAIRDGRDGSKLVLFSPDPGGAELASPLVLGTSYDVVSYSAECQSDRCRLLANTESDQAQYVEALTFTEAAVVASAEVATLIATSSLEIAPMLRRNDAWLYDLSTRGQPRISRMKLDW